MPNNKNISDDEYKNIKDYIYNPGDPNKRSVFLTDLHNMAKRGVPLKAITQHITGAVIEAKHNLEVQAYESTNEDIQAIKLKKVAQLRDVETFMKPIQQVWDLSKRGMLDRITGDKGGMLGSIINNINKIFKDNAPEISIDAGPDGVIMRLDLPNNKPIDNNFREQLQPHEKTSMFDTMRQSAMKLVVTDALKDDLNKLAKQMTKESAIPEPRGHTITNEGTKPNKKTIAPLKVEEVDEVKFETSRPRSRK